MFFTVPDRLSSAPGKLKGGVLMQNRENNQNQRNNQNERNNQQNQNERNQNRK